MGETPSPHAVAALAVVMALFETLLKRGVLDQSAVGPVLRDAGSYAQALCADCPPEVEPSVRPLLTAIGDMAARLELPQPAPIPLLEPP
jgi:hypothetical protein